MITLEQLICQVRAAGDRVLHCQMVDRVTGEDTRHCLYYVRSNFQGIIGHYSMLVRAIVLYIIRVTCKLSELYCALDQ